MIKKWSELFYKDENGVVRCLVNVRIGGTFYEKDSSIPSDSYVLDYLPDDELKVGGLPHAFVIPDQSDTSIDN